MSIDIARLTRKVDVDDRIDLRYYYTIANNLIIKADTYRAERKLLDLYVTLVRFVSLITETIPYHKDYRLSLQSERKDFKRRLPSVMAELETLKPDVEWRFSGTCKNLPVPADRHAQPQQNGSPVRETEPLVERHLVANDLSATPLPYRVSISPSPVQNGTVSRSSHVANSAPEQPLVSRAMPVPTFLNDSAPEQPLVNRIMPVPTSSSNSAPEQPLVNRTMPVPSSSTDSAPRQSLENRIIPVLTSSTNSAPEQPLVSRTMPVPTFLTDLASQQPWSHRIMPIPTSSTDSAPEQPVINRTMPVPNFLRHLVSSSEAQIIEPRSTGITSSRTTEPDLTDLEHDELTRAIKASIETAIAEGVEIDPSLVRETSRTGTTISLHDPAALYTTTLDQETYDNASDASPKQVEEGQNEKGLCIVCLDSQVEAACIPCGHMAGCLACFKKVEAKSKKCPVCRATVDQVVKIYTV